MKITLTIFIVICTAMQSNDAFGFEIDRHSKESVFWIESQIEKHISETERLESEGLAVESVSYFKKYAYPLIDLYSYTGYALSKNRKQNLFAFKTKAEQYLKSNNALDSKVPVYLGLEKIGVVINQCHFCKKR